MIEKQDDINMEDVLMWQWKLFVAFGHFCAYANQHNLPVKITSLASDRENVRAVSRTHEEGRAIDISSKNWSKDNIKGAIEYMNKIAGHYGAFSYRDQVQRVIIHHEAFGQGDHFHIQVMR